MTREQLIELLAANAPAGSVWLVHEDKTTEIVENPTVDQLAEYRSWTTWPMYLIRTDLAENYIREHGLDGAVTLLNLTFALIPDPRSTVIRAAAITGRFLNRRKTKPAQED
ncbi:hypothetical protein CH302_23720 [Rhodococcus sp. 15-2388-1-1a]|nr:hypothetical protein CH302_23720 [Rhodococcus sp. 15-2388-1-1a]